VPVVGLAVTYCAYITTRRRGSGLDGPGFEFGKGQETALFDEASRWAPRLTQPPVQWVLGFCPRGLWGRDVKLTNHRIVPRLRMSGVIPLIPLH